MQTHIAVDHSRNMVHVETLDEWRCEEEVGVVDSIAPHKVVGLGVSGVPLITKGQNELDAVKPRPVNNVVQSAES